MKTLKEILEVLRLILAELKKFNEETNARATLIEPFRTKGLMPGYVVEHTIFRKAGLDRESKYMGEKTRLLKQAVKNAGVRIIPKGNHWYTKIEDAGRVIVELKKLI